MQEYRDQIVVNEAGAFIPRKLFGLRDQIVNGLDQAGVFAPAGAEQPRPQVRRVPPIDLSRELQWLKEHRHEYMEQWVALDEDRLVGHGPNAREVYAAARAAGVKSPFVEFISAADELPFGGW